MNKVTLGIIGGSGVYSMKDLTILDEMKVQTPFGETSSPITIGEIGGTNVAFLARHGIGHFINPTEVNYRANIYALKSIGVKQIVSISACGSLREDFKPGEIVIPDQIFDFTKDRVRTFFSDGLVAHVGVADPFCNDLSSQVFDAVTATGAIAHKGGTLITIEGPRFSTKAESNTFRTWGMSIIGMTASPEAFLAREAEICYSTMAHVTDYDVWHTSNDPVTVEMVIRTLNSNTQVAQESIKNLVKTLSAEPTCSCQSALADALITNPAAIPMETKNRLGVLVKKYIR